MKEEVKEHLVAVFHLVKKKEEDVRVKDVLGKHYNWWIVYYYLSDNKLEEKLTRIDYTLEEFEKEVIGSNGTEFCLPVRNPKYIVEFGKELGLKIGFIDRKIKFPTNEVVGVTIPVIYFGVVTRYHDDHRFYEHIMFSVTIETYEDPDIKLVEVKNLCRWALLFDQSVIEILAVTAIDRYKDYRFVPEAYLSEGIERVLRVGKAFRALYGLL
ncbi:MAG: hypothetical protein QW607_01875 [Desulfurococcaceae archaeon]